VTDPPYAFPGGGFMGSSWDAFESPRRFEEWCREWAAECFRVLKPGGHLVAFGATRCYHRLASGVEDAGFEIRDSIHWVYGCLTDDVEVLTPTGWRSGIDLVEGDLVAQWDPATGAVTLAAVDRTYRAPWDGPMTVLRNADTDQMLTPNHRVWHQRSQRRMTNGVRREWYDNVWTVAEAADLRPARRLRLPVAGLHDGPGIGGTDYAALLGWVWTEGGFDLSGTGVRIYQSSVNSDKVAQIAALMDRLGTHKRYDRTRTYRDREYVETTWFFSGDLANRVRADLPGKRPTYELLWRMTAAEKEALLEAALLGDGHQQRKRGALGAWQFFQKHEDDLVWFQTLLALTGRAGKVGMRDPATGRSGGAVYARQTATTELQHRHLDAAMWESYTGEVWCIGVPSGAFVARRNGKVFITGNSGFPKSMNVGKAIAKRAGGALAAREAVVFMRARREELGLSRAEFERAIFDGRSDGNVRNWEDGISLPEPGLWPRIKVAMGLDVTPFDEAMERGDEVVAITRGDFGYQGDGERWVGERVERVPTSDLAERWSSWGTALKPAHEPILLARKPLSGTLAANVLEHGTGALNIDGTRVAPTEAGGRPAREIDPKESANGAVYAGRQNAGSGFDGGSKAVGTTTEGRWPANFVMSHLRYDYYALRDDLPAEVEDAIVAYYGNLEALRPLRRADLGDAVGPGETEVLLDGVHGGFAEGGPQDGVGDDQLSSVQRAVRGDSGVGAKRSSPVLLGSMPTGSERKEPEPAGEGTHHGGAGEDVGGSDGPVREGTIVAVEGRDLHEQRGLPVRDDRPAPRGDASARQADGQADTAVRGGAPGGSSSEAGTAADDERGGAPREWGEGGQPPGEPDCGPEGGAFGGSSGDRATVRDVADRGGTAPGGERGVAIPAELIPPGWSDYFTFSHSEGCRQVGTRTVKTPGKVGYEGGKTSAESGASEWNRWRHVPEWECEPGCPVAALDEQSGDVSGRPGSERRGTEESSWTRDGGKGFGMRRTGAEYSDTGGASRFFPTFEVELPDPAFMYVAKAPSSERPVGEDGTRHPTVKPLALMRWLCRLVTPPSTWHCPACSTLPDREAVQRMPRTVHTQQTGTDRLFGAVQEQGRRASTEAPLDDVPPVRDDSQAGGGDVLLRRVPGGEPGDSPLPVSRVRNDDEEGASEVLLTDVRGGGDAGPHANPRASVREVRDDILAASEDDTVLLAGVCRKGGGSLPTQDHANRDATGLPGRVSTGAPDGVEDRDGVGASDGHGGALGSDADRRRGRAPQERRQGGQPAGESGSAPEARARQAAEAAEAGHLSALRRCRVCGTPLESRPGVILEPFAGSGTTIEAAILEGFNVVAVEKTGDYLPLIRQRIERGYRGGPQYAGVQERRRPVDDAQPSLF